MIMGMEIVGGIEQGQQGTKYMYTYVLCLCVMSECACMHVCESVRKCECMCEHSIL